MLTVPAQLGMMGHARRVTSDPDLSRLRIAACPGQGGVLHPVACEGVVAPVGVPALAGREAPVGAEASATAGTVGGC